MHTPRSTALVAAVLTGSMIAATAPLGARTHQSPPPTTTQNPPATTQNPPPDNSAVNKTQGTTADQQKNKAADLYITKRIRQGVIKDKTLSTYAHNVKIVTKDGTVTLTGPVRSDDEKTAVAKIATDIVGTDHLVNNITIKAKQEQEWHHV